MQEAIQNLSLHVERQHLFVILAIGELITAGLAGESDASGGGHGTGNTSHHTNGSGGNSSSHHHTRGGGGFLFGSSNNSLFFSVPGFGSNSSGGGEHAGDGGHGDGNWDDTEHFWLVGLVVLLVGNGLLAEMVLFAALSG
jgi:hypothetical protein